MMIKKETQENTELPLQLKYRPKTFETIVGNTELVQTLIANITSKNKPTTFLFQGPRGCGKTTLSRIVAKELGATNRNIKELNIANTRGIDQARSIIENAKFSPLGGKSKVIILNECHKSTNDFQNAMLEILEEPPKNTYFILCTTEPEKLLKTIKSRCTIFQVNLLKLLEIEKLIKRVLVKEKKKTFPKECIKKIATASKGSPREALTILNSVITLTDIKIIKKIIEEYSFENEEVINLCRAIYAKKSWKEISQILRNLNNDPEEIRYVILKYFSTILLNKPDDRCVEIIETFWQSFSTCGKAGLISSCFLISNT